MPTLSEKKRIATLERENAELRVKLESARKLAYLGMMATTVAHEVSQPVHIIRATSSAALEDIKDNLFKLDEIKPIFERIHCQTTRLNQLIQNFRQLARSNKHEAVNINQLIENTIGSVFEQQFKHHNIHLIQQLESTQSRLITYANPFQLQAVLSILLDNAFHALEGRKNACVWVKTFSYSPKKVGFKIEDNGAGLAPEYRELMFKPFSTKTTEPGTGLGLYLAYKIIEELKGELYYEDRQEGGARFIVTLPEG